MEISGPNLPSSVTFLIGNFELDLILLWQLFLSMFCSETLRKLDTILVNERAKSWLVDA